MIRFTHKRTALVFGIGLVFALSSLQVQAKTPDAHFYPARPWAVTTQPELLGGSENAECGLGTEFNNGFVISVDGDDGVVEALNIDFAQDAFEEDNTYNVSITIPGLYARSMTGTAKKAHLLRVPLDESADLYRALLQSAVLDLDVESNAFRFYMTGFPATAGSFDTCIGAHNDEQEVVSTDDALMPPPPQIHTEPLEDLPEEEDFWANDSDVETLDEQENTAETAPETDSTESKDAEASQNHINVKTEIKIHKEVYKTEADFTDLGIEEDDPFPENATEDLPFPDEPFSPDKMALERIERLQQAVTDLEVENRTLRNETRSQTQTDSGAIKTLQSKNKTLQADLAALRKQKEERRISLERENWNLERATMRFNEAERQVKRLGQQLQEERAQCTAEKRELEAMLFDPQVTKQQQLAKLSALESELRETKRKLTDQRRIYEQRIHFLENNKKP